MLHVIIRFDAVFPQDSPMPRLCQIFGYPETEPWNSVCTGVPEKLRHGSENWQGHTLTVGCTLMHLYFNAEKVVKICDSFCIGQI